ncbi:MAG: (d)CMP kinase [Pseudomonadota bacterium]
MNDKYGNSAVPVITIDGPSGAGKGTIGRLLANALGWAFLDSGALYRLTALAAQHHNIALDNEGAVSTLAAHLDVEFVAKEGAAETVILLEGEDVTNAIRTEECGRAASMVAALPSVRQALLDRQRAFREPPGLVADGRDMGSVVFPDAPMKVFLTASAGARAQRRYNQLMEKGLSAKLADLLDDIQKRDERDQSRSVAPLQAPPGALMLDTTDMTIDEVVTWLKAQCRQRLGVDPK